MMSENGEYCLESEPIMVLWNSNEKRAIAL